MLLSGGVFLPVLRALMWWWWWWFSVFVGVFCQDFVALLCWHCFLMVVFCLCFHGHFLLVLLCSSSFITSARECSPCLVSFFFNYLFDPRWIVSHNKCPMVSSASALVCLHAPSNCSGGRNDRQEYTSAAWLHSGKPGDFQLLGGQTYTHK